MLSITGPSCKAVLHRTVRTDLTPNRTSTFSCHDALSKAEFAILKPVVQTLLNLAVTTSVGQALRVICYRDLVHATSARFFSRFSSEAASRKIVRRRPDEASSLRPFHKLSADRQRLSDIRMAIRASEFRIIRL